MNLAQQATLPTGKEWQDEKKRKEKAEAERTERSAARREWLRQPKHWIPLLAAVFAVVALIVILGNGDDALTVDTYTCADVQDPETRMEVVELLEDEARYPKNYSAALFKVQIEDSLQATCDDLPDEAQPAREPVDDLGA